MLRKILFVNDIVFNFEFLKDDFVDNNNPSLTLDIKVENVKGSVSGQDWTRFLQVLEQIMMSRGEKATEVIIMENRRNKEMKRMKTDYI